MARTIREQVLGYLREGKVIVHFAARQPAVRRPYSIRADVMGQTRWVVGYEDGQWWCSGPDHPQPCRHIAAVQMVTGHPSAAARPGPDEPADTADAEILDADDDMDLDALLDMRAQARPEVADETPPPDGPGEGDTTPTNP
jgi:hypothetical protein